MKIGIVGHGYWGKIILRNLENMNYKEIALCDIAFLNEEPNDTQNYEICSNYKDLTCDYVFITTPTSTHFEITKYFLEKKVNVFCEKPLTTSSTEAEVLYDIASKNKTILFTDWIFTYSSHIKTIKADYESGKLGKVRSILMNRLNLGPERFDVNARWDLASHDISIIQYLFSEEPVKIKWTDYKRNKVGEQDDSSLGLIEYSDFTACINASWHYRKKVRECIFEFENYFIVWDDYKRFLQYEDSTNWIYPIYSGNLSYPCNSYQEPLKIAIEAFFSFSNQDLTNQKQLTIESIKILEA
ncbi:MAG: Gfo/Idh/MocA family protein [Promethearchaeota archaeon]